jgi:6-phosphogluconolactonase
MNAGREIYPAARGYSYQKKVQQMKKTIVFSVVALALSLAQSSNASDHDKKAVFVMTNAAKQNQILSYSVQPDGSLEMYESFATGGRGSGGTTDPLGSQGSLTLSQDHSLLFAVNAGSGEISSFRVDGPKLNLADVKPTSGSAPVAVAEHGGLVYVLNFAGNSNVVGFRVDDGNLKLIQGSQRFLTAANSGAASLAFSPDGTFLVVTEKLTNKIDVFPVMSDGTLGPVVTTNDPVAGLFEVIFAPDGGLMALHAASGMISSFLVQSNGALTPQTVLPTVGGASCWLVITPDSKYIYTSNAGSANISGFAYAGLGLITPLSGGIVASYPAGSTNLDIAASGDSKYIYTLNSGSGSIGMLGVQNSGVLKVIGVLPAFTAMSGANGIAAL